MGTPSGQKPGRPADLSGPHRHTWDTRPHLHAHSCSASMLPSSVSGSVLGSVLGYGSGGREARTRQGLWLPCPDRSLPPLPSLPAARSFLPGSQLTCSLTHSDPHNLPAGQAWLIFGTSWKASCFPAGGNAWLERGLFQRREGPCLPVVLPFSLSLSPQGPGGPSECRVALESRRGGCHPTYRPFPCPAAALLPSWAQRLALPHSVVGTLPAPTPQSLDLR